MTTVRWRLTESLGATHTYGYTTKSRRIALKLEKSHHNDAFVIAGGSTQKRATPIFMTQARRNKRKLERFYDAKYIDIRTGKSASGQELSSGRRKRNTAKRPHGKNKSGPNLRIYRGKKVRASRSVVTDGRRSIRRKRYPLQPLDVVSWKAEKYVVKGTHGYGRYVKLKYQTGKVFNAKVAEVIPLRITSGIYIK